MKVLRDRNKLGSAEKIEARKAVASKIRSGELTPRPCVQCGENPGTENGKQIIQAHHHNGYSVNRRLDIVWLCRRCHRKEHRSGL